MSDAILAWRADLMDPLGIWATFPSAAEPYTLYWDDGAVIPMSVLSRPVRHSYERPGPYVLLATTTANLDAPATAAVVLRADRSKTMFTLGDDRRTVTADLPFVPAPLLYRIDWGDGTVTSHGVTDRSPDHTYQPGLGTPTITVTDVPARWAVRYAGPTIAPHIVKEGDPFGGKSD